MDFKRWYKSRTIRIAIFQAVIGIIIAFESSYPELKAAGVLAALKSLLDMALRYDTETPIL